MQGRLRRVDCSGSGIRRSKRGRGFTYIAANGRRITDAEVIARIQGLAIPPAWTDVWICADPLGHIQATGIDAAGRKQYRYHDHWSERSSQRKFESMREFARALPRLRRAISADLGRRGMPRERTLAVAVRLLDVGLFRVGGERYAQENGSYGLATIRRDHVAIQGSRVVFDFPAKSGQHRRVAISDLPVKRAVESLRRRRGGDDELLAFRENGEWLDVRSVDINDYIRLHAGNGFSAKDFRTWHGTVLAAVELAREPPPTSKAAAKRSISAAVERVSELLGNTPAVCRRSYIDPRVIQRFEDGETIPMPKTTNGRLSNSARTRLERSVLRLVE
jgi:DNA topoisomerase-1